MPGSTQRGQVKGGVLQEWRVGSLNLKEDRVLSKTLGMIDVQMRAFATLMKVDELVILSTFYTCIMHEYSFIHSTHMY